MVAPVMLLRSPGRIIAFPPKVPIQMRLLPLAALLLASSTASANDTTAATGAGGLEIRRTDAIDMVSEDLFISASKIEVRYLFRNRTRRDVTTIVAFPMPPRDLSQEYGNNIAYPSNFQTFVAGRRVTATLERKAMVGVTDHRAMLESMGVPVDPKTMIEATKVMDRLPSHQRAQLVKLGLAGEEEWDDSATGMVKHLIPLWTVQDVWWWNETFRAGRDVRIVHHYAPGTGGSTDTPLRYKNYRSNEEARRMIMRYCIDPPFLAGIDRVQSPNTVIGLPDRRIDYVLKTGANWRSPIRDFRLVVDKGKASNLMSFCGSGIRKIGPTLFEMRRRNWRPTEDLHILIVEAHAGR